MDEKDFENLSRGEIKRRFITLEQKNLLGDFFGTGIDGVRQRLQNFSIPLGLKRETLLAYREIAKRVIAEKLDKKGVQVLRLELTEKALAKMKG